MYTKSMKWNPIVNGLAAVAYVGSVATLIHWISSFKHDTPDTIVDGIAFLSLFTFSAAVMAFLFFYRPMALTLEGRASEGLSFFTKTLLTFGIVTAIAIALVSLL